MMFPVGGLDAGEQTIDLEMLELPLKDDAFQHLRNDRQIGNGSDATAAKCMKIGQYCKHVELEQFLAGFRVVRVCQR